MKMTNLEKLLKSKIARSVTSRTESSSEVEVFYIDIFRGEVKSYEGWKALEGKVRGFDVKNEIAKRYLRKVVWSFNRWVYA